MEATARPANGEGNPTRFSRIKQDLLSAPVHLCPERATAVTHYFRNLDDPAQPMVIRTAGAFRHQLMKKSARIFPDELIVGNVGGRRKSAVIHPELSGVFASDELLWIDKRKVTPFQISWPDRLKLAVGVLPYWLGRNLVIRSFRRRPRHLFRFLLDQLNATYYLVNELAGLGHFIPNHKKVLARGLKGCLQDVQGKDGDLARAVEIACEGLLDFSGRLAGEAERLAGEERDGTRRAELAQIARICRTVPYEPAETFHEALQSVWLVHLGACLEGVNSAISFGRIDQYLYPYYRRDVDEGRLTPARARELLLCFSAKAAEHVFLVSTRANEYHGGYAVVQATIVGGMDRQGNDAVNDLTYLFLDVMEESGLREPQYMVRIHRGSPARFVRRAADIARKGNGFPAFFNDEAIIPALLSRGFPLEDARDYGIVGCVEPTIPGKSFLSTDAAIFNLPVCLELALNRGRRFGGRRRIGAETPDPSAFSGMDQVVGAFRAQVEHMAARLIGDLHMLEKGHRDWLPTPFTSMLVDGCVESGRDVTAGGALYTGSGIQGAGVAETADCLAALDEVVFRQKKYPMERVLRAVRRDYEGDLHIHAALLGAAKFGNDHPLPDGYAGAVVDIFHEALARHANSRGGRYVSGFYSGTCHVAFGKRTGALPSGRRAGEPFSSSLGPSNGRDRLGATAVLNSVARVNPIHSPNGYALNLQFDSQTLAGDRGVDILSALVKAFFESGGMQMQLNVHDAGTLQDARAHPGKYPGLVVRLAGYCVYFDDLNDQIKQEIISRSRLGVG
jgi:formate C-acetyltransferase